jgi:hypothetical protein
MGGGRIGTGTTWARRTMRAALVAGVVTALLAPASPARAATFTVTNNNDAGPGSLRQAVADANAAAGPDTIDFAVTGTITLGSSLPPVTQALTITGPGSASLTISGGSTVGILEVNSPASLDLRDVTIAHGNKPFCAGCGLSPNHGGGIYVNNGATLSVTNSVFSGNHANSGGAIGNEGTLTVTNSTFSGNTAGEGGAIMSGSSSPGTLTVTGSTFSGNSVGAGGGAIYKNQGTAAITNSTFSGNSAGFGGGGVFYDVVNTFTNSTFSANSGGGIYNPYGTLQNTIVSGTSGPNCAGMISDHDGGGNLSWPDATCPGINVDPLLDPAGLQPNGGPTNTIMLQAGSPAIDAAVPANCPGTDQRGVPRPQGDVCDIGAVEREPDVPTETFEANLTFDQVCWYQSFASDASVTVEVRESESAAVALFGPASVPQEQGCVDPGLDLVSGMFARVTGDDSGVTKELALVTLSVDSLDPDTDTMTGTGPAGEGVLVEAQTRFSPPLATVNTSADGAGDWTADFAALDPAFDLTEDMGGHAEHFDPDGDTTAADLPPRPAFEAHLQGNSVSGCGFTGNPVQVVVKETPAAATTLFDQPVDNEGCFYVDFWDVGFQLAPGMLVSVTDDLVTKEHVVANLSIDAIDPDANTAAGTAPPDTTIYVDAFVEAFGDVGWQGLNATSNASGAWSVDFDDIGVDLNPFTQVGTSFPDNDGDATAVDTQFQQPGNEVVTDPGEFQAMIANHTIIDFDELDASPVNNTWVGRTPFPGDHYATSHGVTFTNPDGDNLYIAPSGLFWNTSNSLSVAQFPFDDNADDGNDDDLVIDLEPPRIAVGITLVDNGSHEEFAQFYDAEGNLITQTNLPGDHTEFRAFLGVVSPSQPIARIRILERDSDGDDVNYDDITLVDTLEPLQATQRLKDDVQELVTAGVLTKKQAAPLIAKLDNAMALIAKNKAKAAITKLQDFIKQVQTYVKTGKLPAATGQDLIDQANMIIASLQP